MTAAEGPTIVRFAAVDKTYDGERSVVRNLNLDIARGEFLTMLGPSGSGKTTTLMMLAGFESPTGGEIFLNDRPISRVPPHLRRIGIVFQHYALFPHMSVSENLAFPLEVRGMAKKEIGVRIAQALDMVDLAGFGARRPHQLSGGQQQRVAVARALIFEPELVLMDEPLGALDKQLREQLQYEIKALHRRLGLTIVYVTHDQTEALTMSDRIAVFDKGEIRQLSTPSLLYEQPQSVFVANFVGENNLLTGTVRAIQAGGACIIGLGGGQTMPAISAAPLGLGAQVVLSVRPERIRLDAVGEDTSVLRLTGAVEDVAYVGDHLRIRVTVPGQNSIVIKCLNDGVTPRPRTGEAIALSWAPADAHASPWSPPPDGKAQ